MLVSCCESYNSIPNRWTFNYTHNIILDFTACDSTLTLLLTSLWYNICRCFIMFSVVTNINNKKTKGPTLMEFFTDTGKVKKVVFFFLTTRHVRCVHHGWHGTHTQVVATHASTCWSVCGNNLNIVSMCAVSPVVHTSDISSCKRKKIPLFLWLWKIPLRWVLWFSCYKCL